jgi:hypothetical protein
MLVNSLYVVLRATEKKKLILIMAVRVTCRVRHTFNFFCITAYPQLALLELLNERYDSGDFSFSFSNLQEHITNLVPFPLVPFSVFFCYFFFLNLENIRFAK